MRTNNRVLYIWYGINTIYNLYKEKILPSQLLYGMAEISKKNIDVDYYQIKSNTNLTNTLLDIMHIVRSESSILFFPYNYSKLFLIILFMKYVKFHNKKIIAIQHNTLKANKFKSFILKRLYTSLDKIYFLSPLNMKECVGNGLIPKIKSEILPWGVDLNFYNEEIRDKDYNDTPYFISTGMENRDFKTLIKGALLSGCLTEIFIPKNCDVKEIQTNDLVHINYISQKNETIKALAKKVNHCYAVIITLQSNCCDYCVGLTTMLEAMALGKPIIVTKNPYHPIDVKELGVGIAIEPDSPEQLSNAIKFLNDNPEIAKEMGQKGQKIAKEKYNIEVCSNKIYSYIMTL